MMDCLLQTGRGRQASFSEEPPQRGGFSVLLWHKAGLVCAGLHSISAPPFNFYHPIRAGVSAKPPGEPHSCCKALFHQTFNVDDRLPHAPVSVCPGCRPVWLVPIAFIPSYICRLTPGPDCIIDAADSRPSEPQGAQPHHESGTCMCMPPPVEWCAIEPD